MSLDAFLYRLRRKGALDYLTLVGKSNGTVTVLIKNSEGKIMMAAGTSVPSDGGTVYGKGCIFIKTDAADSARALYENIGTKTSCNFDQGAFTDATVDSKITSGSVIASSNLATGDSKASSLSSLVHTADSKAVSVSVIASSNLATGDSKAASNSVLISTADSKAASVGVVASANVSRAASLSTLTATADSKAVSVSVIASANLVTSDSKAASLSVIASANLSVGTSKDTSQSVILSNHASRLASHSL